MSLQHQDTGLIPYPSTEGPALLQVWYRQIIAAARILFLAWEIHTLLGSQKIKIKKKIFFSQIMQIFCKPSFSFLRFIYFIKYPVNNIYKFFHIKTFTNQLKRSKKDFLILLLNMLLSLFKFLNIIFSWYCARLIFFEES